MSKNERLGRYPVHHPAVAGRTLDGEAVLVHTRTRKMHILNDVATFVWEAMAEGTADVGEIVKAVVGSYEVEAAEAEADVVELVQELESGNLIQFRSAGAAQVISEREG